LSGWCNSVAGVWHTRHWFGLFVMCGGVLGLGGAEAWPGDDL
jgi:hypothetical protein